jgi:hypothetical protein
MAKAFEADDQQLAGLRGGGGGIGDDGPGARQHESATGSRLVLSPRSDPRAGEKPKQQTRREKTMSVMLTPSPPLHHNYLAGGRAGDSSARRESLWEPAVLPTHSSASALPSTSGTGSPSSSSHSVGTAALPRSSSAGTGEPLATVVKKGAAAKPRTASSDVIVDDSGSHHHHLKVSNGSRIRKSSKAAARSPLPPPLEEKDSEEWEEVGSGSRTGLTDSDSDDEDDHDRDADVATPRDEGDEAAPHRRQRASAQKTGATSLRVVAEGDAEEEQGGLYGSGGHKPTTTATATSGRSRGHVRSRSATCTSPSHCANTTHTMSCACCVPAAFLELRARTHYCRGVCHTSPATAAVIAAQGVRGHLERQEEGQGERRRVRGEREKENEGNENQAEKKKKQRLSVLIVVWGQMHFKSVVIWLVPYAILLFFFFQTSQNIWGSLREEEKPDRNSIAQHAGHPSSPETWNEWMDAQTPHYESWWSRLTAWHGGDVSEGHLLPPQAFYYSIAARLPAVRQVCEIGFNGGHSAVMWLSSKPNLLLQEFDLGVHDYVLRARDFVDRHFPGRLNLTLGDSARTVPEFVRHNPGFVCDVLHVDGNHDGEMPLIDMMNMRALARPHSLLFLDDVACTPGFCADPQKAWDKLKRDGVIEEWHCTSVERGTRGWCVGRYLF